MNGCIQENDLPWFCTDGFDMSMKINQNKKWDTSIFYSNKDAESELMRVIYDMLYTAMQLDTAISFTKTITLLKLSY